MALPVIEGTGQGKPVTIFYHDGTKWVAFSKATFDDILTALEKIDDLQGALDSVGTDELDVMVEGFDPVPSSPVQVMTIGTAVNNQSVTTIATYTVTTDKTLYITDIMSSLNTEAAANPYFAILTIGGTEVWRGRNDTDGCYDKSFRTPLKATSGQVVNVRCYQWSGVAKNYNGGIVGFEV